MRIKKRNLSIFNTVIRIKSSQQLTRAKCTICGTELTESELIYNGFVCNTHNSNSIKK